MPFYYLFCTGERKFQWHKVENDEKGEKQTISCEACNNKQTDIITDPRVNLREEIWLAFQKHNGGSNDRKA